MLLPIKRILIGVEVGIAVGITVGGNGVDVGAGCMFAQAVTRNNTTSRNNFFFIVFPFQNNSPTSAEVEQGHKWNDDSAFLKVCDLLHIIRHTRLYRNRTNNRPSIGESRGREMEPAPPGEIILEE